MGDAVTVTNMHLAKTQLSKLVDEALNGGDVVIARAGKPVVRLVPVEPPTGKRRLGILSHLPPLPPDFDDPLPNDILELFYGGPCES